MDTGIILKTGDISVLDSIQELWEELNELHMETSIDFKHHYRAFTFQARKKSLLPRPLKGSYILLPLTIKKK